MQLSCHLSCGCPFLSFLFLHFQILLRSTFLFFNIFHFPWFYFTFLSHPIRSYKFYRFSFVSLCFPRVKCIIFSLELSLSWTMKYCHHPILCVWLQKQSQKNNTLRGKHEQSPSGAAQDFVVIRHCHESIN